MTQTHSIISNKLEGVQQEIKVEDLEIQKLEGIERALQEVLEGGDTEISPIQGTGAGGQIAATSGGRHGRQDTLREIVLHAMSSAGRAITVPEVEAAARSIRGKAVRKQGIYSTLHEMVNNREIKRVKPGLYRAVASKN